MPFTKREYVDQVTVIPADNLNDIQDELLRVGGGLDGLPATEAPQMDGTAAVGSSSKLAREDHVHPSDTSRVPGTRKVNNKELSGDVTLGADDLQYNSSAQSHTSGSVGEALASQSRRIDDVTNTTHSLSGSLVEITDGVEGAPLKSCVVNVTAVQAGSGDPSPENIRAISGWTEANLYRAGKNLISTTVDEIKARNTRGTWNGNAYTDAGVTFTLNVDDNGNVLSIKLNGTNTSQTHVSELVIPTNAPVGSLIMTGVEAAATEDYYIGTNVSGSSQYLKPNTSGGYISVTTTASNHSGSVWCAVTRLKTVSNAVFKPMLRYASVSDATYEPFGKQFVAQFGDTYYGGQYNYLTGLLTVTKAYIDLGGLTWTSYTSWGSNHVFSSSAISLMNTSVTGYACEKYTEVADPYKVFDGSLTGFCVRYDQQFLQISDPSYTDATTFKTSLDGVKFTFPLATPIEIQLSPQEVTLLANSNTIWADCGDVSIEYGGYIGSLEDAIARLTARVAALENA